MKKTIKKGVIWIFIFMLGALLGAGGAYLVLDSGLFSFSFEWNMITLSLAALFLLLSMFVNINIHEFGHFVAGKLLGYRLLSYRISIFSWNLEDGKMKFSISRNKGYGGLCAMLPTKGKGMGLKAHAFYASGGVLLNFITGMLFLVLAFFVVSRELLQLFFGIAGIMAWLLGMMNLIPFTSANIPSDGKILWSIFGKKPYARKILEMNQLASQLTAGIRPKNLQITTLKDVDQQNTTNGLQPFEESMIIYFYYQALDRKDREQMLHYARWMQKHLHLYSSIVLPVIYYELCYVHCLYQDKEQAKYFYEKAGKGLQKDRDVNGLRVKAYYAYYIEKDMEKTSELCNEALKVVDRFPIKGLAVMEKELLQDLRHKLSALKCYANKLSNNSEL